MKMCEFRLDFYFALSKFQKQTNISRFKIERKILSEFKLNFLGEIVSHLNSQNKFKRKI